MDALAWIANKKGGGDDRAVAREGRKGGQWGSGAGAVQAKHGGQSDGPDRAISPRRLQSAMAIGPGL